MASQGQEPQGQDSKLPKPQKTSEQSKSDEPSKPSKQASNATDKRYWENPVWPDRKPQPRETRAFERGWLKYTTLGLEMGVIITFFVVAGVAIDKHSSMRFPLFTLLGLALGMTIAMVRLVKVSKMP